VPDEAVAVRDRCAARVLVAEEQGGSGCPPRARRDHGGTVVLVVDLDLGKESAVVADGCAHESNAHECVAEHVAVAEPEQDEDRKDGEGAQGAAEEANQVAHEGAFVEVDRTKRANREIGWRSRCRMA